MSKYDLSICLAAIRKENWRKLYDSIVESIGQYRFELILCGPYGELPESMQDLPDVTCIQDFGCPTRAQQIAMSYATGRYVAWAADDGWFLPGKLEQSIYRLDCRSDSKRVLVTSYVEGGELALRNYTMNFHEPIRSPYYPDNFVIFNSVIWPTEYYMYLGGFDCRFEGWAMACADVGARAQKDGCSVEMGPIIFECTQQRGDSGDHGPVHYSQLDHDQPLYAEIWRDPSCVDRVCIDYDNWKDSPAVWERRFDKDLNRKA